MVGTLWRFPSPRRMKRRLYFFPFLAGAAAVTLWTKSLSLLYFSFSFHKGQNQILLNVLLLLLITVTFHATRFESRIKKDLVTLNRETGEFNRICDYPYIIRSYETLFERRIKNGPSHLFQPIK